MVCIDKATALKPLYEQKCSIFLQHIYESYPERDAGVYAMTG